jgi:hypothetical protein
MKYPKNCYEIPLKTVKNIETHTEMMLDFKNSKSTGNLVEVNWTENCFKRVCVPT